MLRRPTLNPTLPLILLLLLTFAPSGQAVEPEQLTVLNAEENGVKPDQLLHTYLMTELRKCFDARRAEVGDMLSPEKFEDRRRRVREDLFRINGPLPEKTDLNPLTLGVVHRPGYRIEKIIYDSRPGHRITANLYVPDNLSEPAPGVLVPCGHSSNGKASEAYQSICASLALRGMVALIYDPIGQGERHQIVDDDGKVRTGGTPEHSLIGVGATLVGLGTHNYRIWDGIRSIDYLVSRPEVDPHRIGCTGNSGGGTLTAYLMAFDDRIFAAAPSCYLTTMQRLLETIGPQDAEQNFPNQIALGIDHADYVTLRAPKPTLICVGTLDYFDIDGAWTTFREAKRIYGMLGHGDRVDLFEYHDQHGFSLPRRQAAMRFFRRWLQQLDDNPEEGRLELCTDAELQVTGSGEVVPEFSDELTVFDISQQQNAKLAPQRAALWSQPLDALQEVRRLTGYRSIDDVQAIVRGTVRCQQAADGWDGTIEKLILQRPGEVPVPALLFVPDAARDHPAAAVVYASGQGKASALSQVLEHVRRGQVALSIDVRGCGETTADAGRRKSIWFGTSFQTAQLAMHLARPLLGQRVEDIVAAVNFLSARPEVDSDRISLTGTGECGPAALHAAALDARIGKVTIVSAIQSWTDVVNTSLTKNQLVNVVPAALVAYDLPDLVAAIAPRQVHIVDPVEPSAQ